MRLMKIKLFALLTLMLCMGVFSAAAYASDGGGEPPTVTAAQTENTPLTVTAAWVDGELLRINVTDSEGAASSLALRLSDYVSDAENKEYISIQAVDLAGNKSGVIEIKNPYYDPSLAETPAPEPEAPAGQPKSSESAVTDGEKPLTPDGAGTVVDNVEDGDGKEFFTVSTEDGSVFYLIIDRQKNADNVYLLNTVTEDDLIALAKENGRELGASAIPTPEQTQAPTPEPEQTAEPETEPPSETPAKNDTGTYLLIGAIVVIVGGAGYYFKIVRGRKNGDYPDEEDNAEDEYGYDDDTEDDEDDDAEDGGDKA